MEKRKSMAQSNNNKIESVMDSIAASLKIIKEETAKIEQVIAPYKDTDLTQTIEAELSMLSKQHSN